MMKELAAMLLLLFCGLGMRAQVVLYADKCPGGDTGEKISKCIQALPESGGICDARNFTGEQRSAAGFTVGAAAKPVQLLLGPITLVVSKPVDLQAKSSIVGLPWALGIGIAQGATVIKAGANTNLAAVVQIDGSLAALQDVTVDGNRKNNQGEGVGLLVNNASRAEIFRVTVQNAPGHGFEVFSKGASDSCCDKLQKVMAIANAKSGLYILRTGDIMVALSEFENNGQHGIEINGSAGIRVEHSDLGGNLGDGINLYGTPSLPSSNEIILGNQFGNNHQADIALTGYNGGYSSTGLLISSNQFVSGTYPDPGKYDAIRIVDRHHNEISGNSFFASHAHYYRSCVNLSGKREKRDLVSNNNCQAAEAGAEALIVTPANNIAA